MTLRSCRLSSHEKRRHNRVIGGARVWPGCPQTPLLSRETEGIAPTAEEDIAPIEVTQDRVRRGDVEIQYFNTSSEDIEIEIIRIEWTDTDVELEFASHQDGAESSQRPVRPSPACTASRSATTYESNEEYRANCPVLLVGT